MKHIWVMINLLGGNANLQATIKDDRQIGAIQQRTIIFGERLEQTDKTSQLYCSIYIGRTRVASGFLILL